jgi:ethanolamine ammonia-lyase small subunit
LSSLQVDNSDGKPIEVAPELALARQKTPARILVGRAGSAYRTSTQLELRQDHATAVDAVHAELDPLSWGDQFVEKWQLVSVHTLARTKNEYLMRPDLGRRLDDESHLMLGTLCPREPVLQVAIGDGLSAMAAARQAPLLLPLLQDGAIQRGWSFGRPFVVHHARVGVLNDIGEILDPGIVILLIGERPGLATAESLSAYLAFRPRLGHTDANRNLISNIHSRGTPPGTAAERILALAAQMLEAQSGGLKIKEDLSGWAAERAQSQRSIKSQSGPSEISEQKLSPPS